MNYYPQLQIFRNMPVQLLRSGSSVPCNGCVHKAGISAQVNCANLGIDQ